MHIKKISASAYNSWDQCNWKYTLNYVLGFEDPSGPAAIMGSIVHDTLETISKAVMNDERIDDINVFISDVWENTFNRYYTENPVAAANIKDDKFKRICNATIDLLNGEYSPFNQKRKIIGTEQWFELFFDGNRFKTDSGEQLSTRGKIDRVDQLSNDTIEVIDYKTGSRKKWGSDSNAKRDGIEMMEDIQPSLYYLAARKLWPKYKNVLVTFIYLVDGGPIVIPLDDSCVKTVEDKILKRFLEIKNNNNPSRNWNWRCKWCYYGPDTGICERIWKEKNTIGLPILYEKYSVVNAKR